jgi:hypothetical protein
MIKRIILFLARNPYIHIFIGAVVLIAGLIEVLENIEQDWDALTLGAHHGVSLMGLWSLLRGCCDAMESFDYLEQGID